jgi:four helix bundle protein
MIRGYRDLEVWQLSMQLVERVFKMTGRLPDEQRFGLASQMQRAVISIPSNIAEGHAKRLGKDYPRHLRIAAGSVAELETQIELCVRLGFLNREDIRQAWNDSQSIAKMLSRLIQRVSSKSSRNSQIRRPA